jgi:16S rRNA processing protein RimM
LEYILIAKVEQLFGKDGFVKVQLFSDFPERFKDLKKIYLDFWGDKKIFYIQDVKNINGKIVIKFKNFDSPRDSEVLIDREVFVDEKDSVRLPENHFFVHDLVGCHVFIEKQKIGIVSDVIKNKANDVLVILTDDKKEKMIPFILSYIEKFDTAGKKLFLNVLKDFFEDDED